MSEREIKHPEESPQKKTKQQETTQKDTKERNPLRGISHEILLTLKGILKGTNKNYQIFSDPSSAKSAAEWSVMLNLRGRSPEFLEMVKKMSEFFKQVSVRDGQSKIRTRYIFTNHAKFLEFMSAFCAINATAWSSPLKIAPAADVTLYLLPSMKTSCAKGKILSFVNTAHASTTGKRAPLLKARKWPPSAAAAA